MCYQFFTLNTQNSWLSLNSDNITLHQNAFLCVINQHQQIELGKAYLVYPILQYNYKVLSVVLLSSAQTVDWITIEWS